MAVGQERTIIRKLWVLSACLIGTIIVIGGLGVWDSLQLIKAQGRTAHTYMPAVRTMTLLDMMHDGIRANIFHAVILSGSKDADEIKDVRDEAAEFSSDIHQYMDALNKFELSPEVKKVLDEASPKVDAYVKVASEISAVAISGQVEQAIEMLPAFQVKFKELETSLGALGDLIEKEAKVAVEQSDRLGERTIVISLVFAILSCIIGAIASYLMIRNLRQTMAKVIDALSKESQTVASSAGDLQAASARLASATTQQASALQQTAASVDEITAMVKKTSDNAKNLEATTQSSQASAVKGQDAITQMLASIETISDSHSKIMAQVEDSNMKITEIVKVISEIGNKTKVINDIVFQTKLLSFNASVEAARAGEHGKGFAVVAEEVGNLAQMSGNAAKEISDMLSTSIEKVESIVNDSKRQVEHLIADGKHKIENGAVVAKDCGNALEEIVKYSSDVASMVGEISTAIGEQNQGIHEISKAIQLLDHATHEISNTSKSSSNTAEGLLDQSNSLLSIVTTVGALIGQGSAKPSNEAKRPVMPKAAQKVARPSTKSKASVVPLSALKGGKAIHSKTAAPRPDVGIKQAVGSSHAPSENDPRFEDV